MGRVVRGHENRRRAALGFILLCALMVGLGAKPGFEPGSKQTRSDARYPKSWPAWVKVKETYIPSAQTPLPKNIPPVIVETIKMYNWINDGDGTRFDIYVNPSVLEAYKRHGPYPDGGTAVGVFADVGVVFVTQHLLGEAMYGTFNSKGEDISGAHETFAPSICSRCHVGYGETCVSSTCAVPDPNFLGRR